MRGGEPYRVTRHDVRNMVGKDQFAEFALIYETKFFDSVYAGR
jgi:hypothetical protein